MPRKSVTKKESLEVLSITSMLKLDLGTAATFKNIRLLHCFPTSFKAFQTTYTRLVIVLVSSHKLYSVGHKSFKR
jgi:hypothetical protein